MRNTPSVANQFKVENWRPLEKNSLRGFLDLVLPSGLVIKEAMLHVRDGKRWIGLPGKPYQRDGKTEYVQLLAFTSKEARMHFQGLALAAVDEALGSEAR